MLAGKILYVGWFRALFTLRKETNIFLAGLSGSLAKGSPLLPGRFQQPLSLFSNKYFHGCVTQARVNGKVSPAACRAQYLHSKRQTQEWTSSLVTTRGLHCDCKWRPCYKVTRGEESHREKSTSCSTTALIPQENTQHQKKQQEDAGVTSA